MLAVGLTVQVWSGQWMKMEKYKLNALIDAAARIAKSYDEHDPYDYVTLIRNVFKRIDTLPAELQVGSLISQS